MVSVVDLESSGLGLSPGREDIVLCSWARYFILSQCLSPPGV